MEERYDQEECLAQAQAAYEANDSKAVSALCGRVLEADPDNAAAWDLMAKFGGWDAKMYTLDMDAAISAARRALSLVPEDGRYDAAAEIYTARKRQIALMLEAEMTMPSHTEAKRLQSTMMDWKRLLEDIPYLTSTLIEGEVTLCENLCLRSKMGIMPGDRLVYTAYTTFNGKETYGETFRKALAARQRKEQARKDEIIADAQQLAADCRTAREAAAASGSPGGGATRLEADRQALAAALAKVEGLSDAALYEEQLREMERERARLKPLQLFRMREMNSRIADVQAKLDQVRAADAQATAPIRAELEAIDARLHALS